MRITIILLLFISIMIGSCHQDMKIVEKGFSKYTIIIPQEANKSDSTAAYYLSKYIRSMTGAEIPIKSDIVAPAVHEICIGNTMRHKLPNKGFPRDGFLIISKEKKIYIGGGSHKGTIYGVIELLERWGCRRFSPTEAHIPKMDDLSFAPIEVLDAPTNSLRIINGKMTTDPEFVDWLRITTIPEVAPPGYYVHTFHRLIPREEFFDEHPEYFAWLGNKYSFDQPCPSNLQVKKLIIERLGKEIEKYPDFDIWSVSQNDNFTYCQCDECMAIIEEEGSPAGPIIRLVNDVAAAYPDKIIATLAYQFSRSAPIKTKPASNVLVRLCTIELNRSRPIEHDSLSHSFVKDISDWGKISNNIYLWDYTINFNHSVSPFPNLHVLQPNLQFFFENNVRWQFPQSNLQLGHEFVELKAQLLSGLMWDPYLDTDSLKDDFFKNYYKEAGAFMRDYADRMEQELIKSGKILYIYEPPNNHSDGYLSAENVAAYNEMFNSAEAAVSDQPVILNRVLLSRLPLQYAIMEIGKNDMFGRRGWYDESDGKFILRHEMKESLESFYSVCITNAITSINERSLSPETYYQSTLRFIDVKVEGNMAFRKPVSVSPAAAEKYAKGNPGILTDGVQGAHDFAVHWLGWWGEDAAITIDLEEMIKPEKIEIGTLWDGRSWILHPSSITCLVSKDGKEFSRIGKHEVNGPQQFEETTRDYTFMAPAQEIRYVRFVITRAGPLPKWHASEGEPSWFFVDEITVF